MLVAPLIAPDTNAPHLALHPIQLGPQLVEAGGGILQLHIGEVVDAVGVEGIEVGEVGEEVLAAVLGADEDTEGDNAAAAGEILAAAHVGDGDGPLLPHGGKEGGQHAAVDGAGYVVVLEGEGVGVGDLLIQDERADDAAGGDLGVVVEDVGEARHVGRVGAAVVDLTALLFGCQDARLAVFLELFADGGLVEHEGGLKARQVLFVDLGKDLGEGATYRGVVKDIEKDEVEGDVPVGEALGLPGVVEGVVGDGAAVDGDEDVLPLGGADKAHVVPQPALHAAALVVIRPRALGLIPIAALEAVHVEIPHIGADALEVLDEFVVGGHGGTPFFGGLFALFCFIISKKHSSVKTLCSYNEYHHLCVMSIKKYFPFISPAKTPTIIPETRQGVRHGSSEGAPRRVLRGLDDIDSRSLPSRRR